MVRRLVLFVVLILASLTFAACSPWTPSDFPVRVDVGGDLNDAQRVALLDGIALLEERVGANVFAPVESNGRRIQRGRISVRNGVKQHGYDGWYERNHWSCRITLERDIYPGVALHELLHCLGLDHEADEDSLMHEYTDAHSKLKVSHVNYVRGLMGLAPSAAPEELDALPEVSAEEAPSDNGNCELPVEDDAGTDVTEDAGVSFPDFTIPDIRVSL